MFICFSCLNRGCLAQILPDLETIVIDHAVSIRRSMKGKGNPFPRMIATLGHQNIANRQYYYMDKRRSFFTYYVKTAILENS